MHDNSTLYINKVTIVITLWTNFVARVWTQNLVNKQPELGKINVLKASLGSILPLIGPKTLYALFFVICSVDLLPECSVSLSWWKKRVILHVPVHVKRNNFCGNLFLQIKNVDGKLFSWMSNNQAYQAIRGDSDIDFRTLFNYWWKKIYLLRN